MYFYGIQLNELCRRALDEYSQLKMRGAKRIGLTLESCLYGSKDKRSSIQTKIRSN